MSNSILLDINEDKIIFDQIVNFCNSNNVDIKVESIFINNTEISLVQITIDEKIIKNKKFPVYPKYINLEIILNREVIYQQVLLQFLKIFYNVDVILKTKILKNNLYQYNYYFIDNVTPFYLKESIKNEYLILFEKIIDKKLVTTNPLIESVLKTYSNSNISRLENYNIWYSDIRADSSTTLEIMNILIEQGYFCISDIMWKFDIKRINIEQAYKIYEFKQLGKDCICKENHFISPNCTCKYLSTLDYSSDNFYYLPIHGPLIMEKFLGEDFLQQCVLAIENESVPFVSIPLNFEASIETQFIAMIGFTQSLCLNDIQCTNISCSDIENINIDNENNLILKCFNIKSILNVCNFIINNNLQLKIKTFTNVQDSINYRLKEWNLNSQNSLLIINENKYIVATWLNNKTQINKKYKNLNIEEIEEFDSINNFELNKKYSIYGYYEIYDKNNQIILPGLLKTMPYDNKLNISKNNIIFKIMGMQCFIYLKPSTLLTIIPFTGNDKNKSLQKIISKFENGDYFNSWGKNYYSLTKEFNSNLFI
jgi:hypothetical protein